MVDNKLYFGVPDALRKGLSLEKTPIFASNWCPHLPPTAHGHGGRRQGQLGVDGFGQLG